MAVYEVLQDIMCERNLSIADIARICNLPDSTVRGIIRRKQNSIALDVAFRLSDGLGVSLERLNGIPENKKAPVSADANTGEEVLSIQQLYSMLIDSGFIKSGEDLSDDDLRFLLSVGEAIHAWFTKGKK